MIQDRKFLGEDFLGLVFQMFQKFVTLKKYPWWLWYVVVLVDVGARPFRFGKVFRKTKSIPIAGLHRSRKRKKQRENKDRQGFHGTSYFYMIS